MEKEVRQLNDLLKILIDVSDKAELLRSKIEQFKQEDIRLYRFHQRLIVKIANICIALEAIASGKVDPSSGGGKLNTSAMVFELLGQTLSLVPMFGSAPGQVGAVVSSVLNYIDKIRQINIATRIANMFTMFDMWHITQEMTIKLTEMYHFQISKISAETKYPIEVTELESDSQKKNCALYCFLTSLTIAFVVYPQTKTITNYEILSLSTSIRDHNETTIATELTIALLSSRSVKRIPTDLKSELYQWTITPDLIEEIFIGKYILSF
ncbi:unnamed protein product [Rotaria sp. Silwood2]|nr:unnamed protein product [Rotaria sp. Silwood2]CAF3959618.1 unnamed protein product [Rotaria sp. Silwood2]